MGLANPNQTTLGYAEAASILVSIVALAISIISAFYQWQRTKIMDRQLTLQTSEAKKKRNLEEVSKLIRHAIRMIRQHVNWGYLFYPLDLATKEILAYIHDNRLDTITLNIEPREMEVVVDINTEPLRRIVVRELSELVAVVDSPNCWAGSFMADLEVDCEPRILYDSRIDLEDAFSAVGQFYYAYHLLESNKHLIDPFNDTILDSLKGTIEMLLKVLFECLTSKHKITFTSKDGSHEILRELRRQLVGIDRIETHLQVLSSMCDTLNGIQKEMFLRS